MKELAVGSAALVMGIVLWKYVTSKAGRAKFAQSIVCLVLIVTGSVTLTGGPIGQAFNKVVTWLITWLDKLINWAISWAASMIDFELPGGRLPVTGIVATVGAATLTGYLVYYFWDEGHRRIDHNLLILAALLAPALALATPGAIGQWILSTLGVLTAPVVDLIASIAYSGTHWS